MAFPADYTKYQEVTIDNTKVTADQTDFPVYIDLSDLSKAGVDIFDTCRTDGGDIRVTKSDGTTELPREVVAIDTTAKTGELHVKYTGTLSSTADTVIRIYYNGTDTEPAASATYGSQNVWTGYDAVWHMQEDPSSSDILDSTANGIDLSVVGSVIATTTTSKLAGNAIDFGTSGTRVLRDTTNDANINYTDSFTMTAWGYFVDNGTDSQDLINKWDSSKKQYLLRVRSGEDVIFGEGNGGASTGSTSISSGTLNGNAWNFIGFVFDNAANTATHYKNGASNGTTSSFAGVPTSSGQGLAVGNLYAGTDVNNDWQNELDELRLTSAVLSSSWHATEYNNQNSPSTFYSVGDEESGGGSPTATPFSQAVVIM